VIGSIGYSSARRETVESIGGARSDAEEKHVQVSVGNKGRDGLVNKEMGE
jgi:hypothetical protein